MYCSSCGKSNDKDAKFCTCCGAPLKRPVQTEAPKTEVAEEKNKESVLGIIALVCAFLVPIVGLILGLVDYNTKDGYSKNFAKWAMIASGAVLFLRIIGAVVGSIFAQILVKDFLEMFRMFM